MAKDLGLFRNLETKAMALVMAIVLYIYAMSERSGQENDVLIPLNVSLPPGTTLLEKQPPSHVRVSFNGPQKAIDKLREVRSQLEFRCVVDEKGHEHDDEWVCTLTLDATQLLFLPPEISLSKVEPSTIALDIARTTTKVLKVRLQLMGEPPPGLEVARTDFWPKTITITAPRKILANATEINTEPIDLSKLPNVDSFMYTVRVEQAIEIKVDNRIERKPIKCDGEIRYWIWLNQTKETLTFKKVPLNLLVAPNFPFVAAPVPGKETVDVTVKGLKQNLARLSAANVKAYVDVNDRTPADLPVLLPVKFILPEDVQGKVEVVNDPPMQVAVAISERPTKEKGASPSGLRP